MQLPKIARSLLWLVGTLAVGALGNGLWELAKPGLVWIGTATLDVATLGMTSLTDDIYSEVARGTYERAAEKVMSILLGLFSGALLMVFLLPILPTRRNRQVLSIRDGLSKYIRFAIVTFAGIMTLTLAVQNYRTIYIIRAANHMEQMIRVSAPFMSDRDHLMYLSRSASMGSRTEYLQITGELSAIARQNNVRVPDFSVY